MSIHTKNFYSEKLIKILNYRSIHISGAELRSYSKDELISLIKKYEIKLNNANNRASYLYHARY